ncbi:MAG: hypothetical protein ACP5QR_03700 [Rhizomicrobium sp.]
MNDIALAIALHILAIVWWIGGVAMVTTVLLPAARAMDNPHDGLAMFRRIEERFAWHARATTLLAGASGLYMVLVLGLWPYFFVPTYWWLDAMLLVWALFIVVLFIAEPLFVDEWLEERGARAPAQTLALLQRLHWIALIISVITVLGAAAGTNGWVY